MQCVIKKLAPVIKAPLCALVNKSMESGVFPDLMKLAKVLPLHKGGELQIPFESARKSCL